MLLGIGHSATVEATEPSVLRRIADGDALLSREPDAIRAVAVGLAQRLNFLTTYLADLTHQYGDAPGLTMVATVLRQLEQRSGTTASPGSAARSRPRVLNGAADALRTRAQRRRQVAEVDRPSEPIIDDQVAVPAARSSWMCAGTGPICLPGVEDPRARRCDRPRSRRV